MSGRPGQQDRRAMFERLDVPRGKTPADVVKPSPSADDTLEHFREAARAEGFELEGVLGTGGMGIVVSARDLSLGRRVALKFLSASPGPQEIERLRREAEKAGRLGHGNIVQVYSWHSVGNLTFYSMELVEGRTLEQLTAAGNLPLSELLRILMEASRGLAAAHAAGILHRDIKPQNILVSDSGSVKLADFGLAAQTNDEASPRRATISGTVGFMAPEQARGEQESFASDTWSLTATLYYALTGTIPVASAEAKDSMLENNKLGRVTPLYTVRADLPPALYMFIARGLDRNKERRFRDGGHFHEELAKVLLRLDDRGEGLGDIGRVLRHPYFVAGVAAGFLLGIVLAGVAWFTLS